MAATWHPAENAVYEIDEECMQAGKGISCTENIIENYFALLVCIYFG